MNHLVAIERLVAVRPDAVTEIARVEGKPIHVFRFGATDPTLPVLILVGGVHGLERIGTEVVVAYLQSVLARLAWDQVLHEALARCRLVILPLLNPIGMARKTRANGNGVDLMRNAPPHPLGGTPLLGGQTISRRLPWFMGDGFETESAALVALVEAETARAPLAIALDAHSGYGLGDRLWYPYARTREPFADLASLEALRSQLDAALPDHGYIVEQTAQAYTIRGDLWDYLYDRRRGPMLPLTLEMGAWTILRGNKRTVRRHLPLFDFLVHAAVSYRAWLR